MRIEIDFGDPDEVEAIGECRNLDDILEYTGHLGNGWDRILPEEIGALTDSPIFSEECERGDQGDLIQVGVVWWYPNYMITDFVETLVTEGFIQFTRHNEKTDGNKKQGG